MATGAGLGGLVTALVPLIGLVTILKGRSRRKRGLPEEPADDAHEKRRAATRESERRMAAYLAQRSTASYHVSEDDEQEIRR
ncbi:MAG: hypothetical protein J0L76_16400 [Rhodobacterales bacterium]|nr:hypothetical protein [Rhodobacterales bacterium]